MAGFLWQGYDPRQLGTQAQGYDPRQLGAQGYPQDPYADKSVYTDQLGFSAASTAAPPDLYAQWGGSMAGGNLGASNFSLASSTQPYRSADLNSFDGINKFAMDSSNLTDYPRIITAARLLEDSDDDSTWCGPPSEPGESAASEKRSMETWGIGNPEDEKETEKPKRNNNRRERDNRGGGATMVAAAVAAAAASAGRGGEASQDRPQREPRERREQKDPARDRPKREPGDPSSRRPPPLIVPRGDVDGDNQKFICVFQIGLEDDEEFCLVKRILGKAGNNMRRIAEECSAKVRLRGIGSGFLEGADGREANMPLQLNVSCTDFDSYQGAVDRVSALLKDLYKHYRRYARSKGQEPPDVKVALEEVRRDDVGLDLLQQKAQRSPSQRERDRRAREKERQLQRDKEREKERDRAERDPNPAPPRLRQRSRDRYERFNPERDRPGNYDSDDDDKQSTMTAMTLPGGAPIPTTPAGRRLAARSGGAEAAAIVSAAARETEKADRDKVRRERDDNREKEKDDRDAKKREAAQRAAALASRTRGGARPAAKPSSAPVSSPATEEHIQNTSSPAKPTSSPAKDSSDAAWNSSKGNSVEEWDPWAAAAKKGKGKSPDETSGKGKGKGSGKKK